MNDVHLELLAAAKEMHILMENLWKAVPWGSTFDLDLERLNIAPVRLQRAILAVDTAEAERSPAANYSTTVDERRLRALMATAYAANQYLRAFVDLTIRRGSRKLEPINIDCAENATKSLATLLIYFERLYPLQLDPPDQK